jgi:hypothetical protein
MIGKDTGTYMVRSSVHAWADFGTALGGEFNELAGEHWNATVHPLVEDYGEDGAEELFQQF